MGSEYTNDHARAIINAIMVRWAPYSCSLSLYCDVHLVDVRSTIVRIGKGTNRCTALSILLISHMPTSPHFIYPVQGCKPVQSSPVQPVKNSKKKKVIQQSVSHPPSCNRITIHSMSQFNSIPLLLLFFPCAQYAMRCASNNKQLSNSKQVILLYLLAALLPPPPFLLSPSSPI